MNDDSLSNRHQFHALRQVATHRPALTIAIVSLSLLAAVLEVVGISFILPVIELAQSGGTTPAGTDGLLGTFVSAYTAIGLPLSIEYVVIGVSCVMLVRFAASFLVSWLRAILQTEYICDLRERAFENALDARIAYFDTRGSDEILNVVVTESRYAGKVIHEVVRLIEQSLLSVMYLLVTLYLAPVMTLLTIGVLGSVTYLVRSVLESGYAVGDRVATANERVQRTAQEGTQGIRDVKVFGLSGELSRDFHRAVNEFATATIGLQRNKAALNSLYQSTSALTVFVLLYLGLSVFSLSLAELSLFLFAMFRLAPQLSNLNTLVYHTQGDLPHVVRAHEFIETMRDNLEPNTASTDVPTEVRTIAFKDVTFTYGDAESEPAPVLDDVSFEATNGESIAFVGQSGVGKSTIVSLLARMYAPDEGTISANDIPIEQFDIDAWRSRVAVVRQQPWIFNDTLRYNLTIGNRAASQEEIDRACEIARVTEFRSELPNGYDTVLGDNGVRLSGGQRQRVAIARALLKRADLLVLDEATSDLDGQLEAEIYRALGSIDRDYITVTIAHRLATVAAADRIYVIENGEIVETGTHETLLANDGSYTELYTVQTT